MEAVELGALPQEDVIAHFRHVHLWAVERGYLTGLPNAHARDWHGGWGERTELSRSVQDLNQKLEQGWRIARMDPLKLSEARAGFVYLLEKD